jgi:molybdopterin adenylyltransferase
MVIKTGILCIPELDDLACLALRRLLAEQVVGAVVMLESAARSQRNWIEEILRRWCDEEELDLVLTLGGTLPAPGPSASEITPEATLAVIERQMPGVPEAMRAFAQEKTMLALLDRGVAGIRGRTLIVNLPEGAAPSVLFFESVAAMVPAIIAHLQGDPSSPRLADEVELRNDQPDDSESVGAIGPRPATTHGLNVDEFAAFLRRSDQ